MGVVCVIFQLHLKGLRCLNSCKHRWVVCCVPLLLTRQSPDQTYRIFLLPVQTSLLDKWGGRPQLALWFGDRWYPCKCGWKINLMQCVKSASVHCFGKWEEERKKSHKWCRIRIRAWQDVNLGVQLNEWCGQCVHIWNIAMQSFKAYSSSRMRPKCGPKLKIFGLQVVMWTKMLWRPYKVLLSTKVGC